MINIMIIHGTGGNPDVNWFPWLKSELEKRDCRVFIPTFPTPKHQSLRNWRIVFKEYEQYLNVHTIVVGHSLGVAFLLSVLEDIQRPIAAAFFVAGFIGLLNNSEFDKLNKTFTTKSFDWMNIKNNCKKFYVINSDNDPYVPLTKEELLAKNLDTELIILKNAGHMNAEAGYTRFDFLLKKLEKEM